MNSTNTYLSLVSDEVNFWFSWLSRRRCRDDDLRLVLRFLHQNINEGLLLILLLSGYYRRRGRGWGRGLNKHNLVVFLGRCDMDGLAGGRVLVIWGRNVDVYMFVDHGGLLRGAVLWRRSPVGLRWRSVGLRRRPVRRRGLRPRQHASSHRRY